MRQGLRLSFNFFISLLFFFVVLQGTHSSQAWAVSRKRVLPPTNPGLNDPQPHGEMILRVMTYNVKALPIWGGADESKLTDIGNILKQRRANGDAPHIVAIQEGFHSYVNALVDAADYPYIKTGPPAEWPQANSGLILLSEYPIVNWARHAFAQENSAGMDWNAKKGVLWTQIQLPHATAFLDMMNTHMQADYPGDIMSPPEETIPVRRRQHVEVRNFFWQQVKADAPVIFAGDFNTTASMEDYYDIIANTFLYNAGEYCAIFGTCLHNVNPMTFINTSVDHQFFRNNGKLRLQPIAFKKAFHTKVNGRMLSDHVALEVHYKITW